MKNAFTMIELVFVIVVLGILAGVAVPRLAMTRDDAMAAKIRGDVAAIRSGISLKKAEMQLEGNASWPVLEGTGAGLFDNVLQNDISDAGKDLRNGWHRNEDGTYQACVAKNCTTFTYYRTKAEADAKGVKVGTFDCVHTDKTCQTLAE
ncbi:MULTISPECIES: type II secretion system protein [unclassified Campylobacter]|uniref:type II secretion system protein n=1 Tax=unclassified Campylobacter TaxID=2593542 RepID=UPI0022E9A16A|nr:MULTISPECIES: prepilin-type N-terminal cleavage/methylation domain-containing protein [unclassified Campylobacter]